MQLQRLRTTYTPSGPLLTAGQGKPTQSAPTLPQDQVSLNQASPGIPGRPNFPPGRKFRTNLATNLPLAFGGSLMAYAGLTVLMLPEAKLNLLDKALLFPLQLMHTVTASTGSATLGAMTGAATLSVPLLLVFSGLHRIGKAIDSAVSRH